MYVSIERLNSPKFSVQKTGLILLNDCSFLGASPNGITSMAELLRQNACGNLEKILPRKLHISSGYVHEVEGKLTLKTNSSWYTKIQIEMAACELEEGALLIYTEKGICIVNVPFDNDFLLHLREKLKPFLLEFVLPVLLS